MAENNQKSNPENIPLFPFQLNDVRLYEIFARRCDPDTKLKETAPISIDLSSPIDEEITEEFGLLLTFKTNLPLEDNLKCEVELSIEGIFHTQVNIDEIEPEVITQFISQDAIVLFWPYLRQYLHDLTEKMRLGMTPLPIIDPRALLKTSSK